LIALAAVVIAACGSGQAAAPPTPPPTVGGVGVLPDPLVLPTTQETTPETTAPEETAPPTTARRTTTTTEQRNTTTTEPRPDTRPVGRIADGNRLLMIGDSILASTAQRYTGEMCASLVPLGWSVELDAETGQGVEFGNEVLDKRLSAGWDAAVVFLGNNYPGQPQAFADQLRYIIARLAPRPTVLVTVSQNEPRQAEVNYIIRSIAKDFDQVRVLDWAAATEANDDLTVGDGLHPTDAGRLVLVSMITGELGRAPRDSDWRPMCLPTQFTDDTN
jgi:hypothetical protein